MSSQQAEVNIGMVGHVDHGKTSLTKALTGIWTDTHSEEVKRGISIRLGYADTIFYKCSKGHYSPKEKCTTCESKCTISRRVSFVDAPGHETLMTTMLSGAALMHGAILVIAANEKCPQPRTEEHLMALEISGVKNVVVAQNKIDLVDEKRAKESYDEIFTFLKSYGYEKTPIIPVSANFEANIDSLIQAIEEHIPSPKLNPDLPVKLFIARSFDINKPGAEISKLHGGILGGSIIQGKLKLGEEIELRPGIEGKPYTLKVKGLNAGSTSLNHAMAGGLIAIETGLDPVLCQNDKLRGHVVGKPGTLGNAKDFISIEFNELERLVGGKFPAVKMNELLVLTIGTMTVVGEVVNIKKKIIDIKLRQQAVVESNQVVAISRREASAWRLAAYGINKSA